MADVKLFLSCVSDEFGAYRDALRRALTRPNVEVKIQEDFKALGGDTLAMLEDYIEQCDGGRPFRRRHGGIDAKATSVEDLLKRRPELAARLADKGLGREALGALTYTQWEAWLAIGFDKTAKENLLIVEPAEARSAATEIRADGASRASQAEHLEALEGDQPLSRMRIHERRQPRRADLRLGGHRRAGEGGGAADTKPRNLPFASLGALFVGRDKALDDLRAALTCRQGRGGAWPGAAWARRSRQDAARHRICAGGARRTIRRSCSCAPTIRPALDANLAALVGVRRFLIWRRRRRARTQAKIEAASAVARRPSDLADDPRQRRRREGCRCRGRG